MRGRLLGILMWSACTAGAAHAQAATVTVYVHGSWANQALPVSRKGVYLGGFWQDGDPLVMFADPLLKVNNRYVVFSIPAGRHVFGLGEGRKPRQSSLLALDLAAGEHRFLWIHAKSDPTGAILLPSIEEVSCAVAGSDLARGEPLDPRSVMRDKIGELSDAQPLPACPQTLPIATPPA